MLPFAGPIVLFTSQICACDLVGLCTQPCLLLLLLLLAASPSLALQVGGGPWDEQQRQKRPRHTITPAAGSWRCQKRGHGFGPGDLGGGTLKGRRRPLPLRIQRQKKQQEGPTEDDSEMSYTRGGLPSSEREGKSLLSSWTIEFQFVRRDSDRQTDRRAE